MTERQLVASGFLFILTASVLTLNAVETSQPVAECSAAGLRYLESARERSIKDHEADLRKINADLRRNKDKTWRRNAIVRKKRDEKTLADLRRGIWFIPFLDYESLSVGNVGGFSFEREQNEFIVIKVLSADSVEAYRVIRDYGIVGPLGRGLDKYRVGPVIHVVGIDTTGMATGADIKLDKLFEVDGKSKTSSGNPCVRLRAVSLPNIAKANDEARRRNAAKHRKAKK